jgi:hypothetical protein
MFDTFWVKINKNRVLYSVERYFLDDSRIIHCRKRMTFTRRGAKIVAKRFVLKKILEAYVKDVT